MSRFSVVHSPSNLRPVLRLALPALAEESLVLMVTWTDWWLTGHYFREAGDATKAAMNLMGYTMWLIPSLFAAIAIGATALIARHVGADRPEQATRVANQAYWLGGLLAIALIVLCYRGGDTFIEWMQLGPDAARYAREYLFIIIPTIPLIMCSQVGAACLRGAGDTVTGFITKLVVVVVNIVVSTALVIGWGPLPRIGWEGLAIGTAAGYAMGGLIITAVLIRGRAGLRLRFRELTPDFAVLKRILRIGLPGGVDITLLLLSQLIFISIIYRLGTSAAASHGLAVQIEACAYLPGAAFQVAAATLAGQFLGAGFPVRASRSVVVSLAVGSAIICSTGVALYFQGAAFATFFTGEPSDPTTLMAARLLQIVAFAMPSLSVVMILTGALRGAGDTIWPLGFTLFGFLIVRIPLAIWLSYDTFELSWIGYTVHGLNWGVEGAWTAMLIDLVIRSGLVAARFWQGGWQRIQVD